MLLRVITITILPGSATDDYRQWPIINLATAICTHCMVRDQLSSQADKWPQRSRPVVQWYRHSPAQKTFTPYLVEGTLAMTLIDSKGRLFGKVSILDVAAALIILMVLFGIFLYPGTSGSVAQVGATTKLVEVDVMVRGLTASDPEGLFQSIQNSETTNIIIRNQPYGQVRIKNVQKLPRSTVVPQPDGSVIALPDPRPELNYTIDMLITLEDNAQITDTGPVFGNSKVKVGTQIELDGDLYNFNTSTVGVRVLEDS